jgi:hypothetical protein
MEDIFLDFHHSNIFREDKIINKNFRNYEFQNNVQSKCVRLARIDSSYRKYCS